MDAAFIIKLGKVWLNKGRFLNIWNDTMNTAGVESRRIKLYKANSESTRATMNNFRKELPYAWSTARVLYISLI